MHRRHLLHFALAGITLPWAMAVSATQKLVNARAWDDGEKLRLVFDLSGPANYQIFSLKAPERLVVDLANTGTTTNLNELSAGNRMLSAIRSGPQAGGTRVVLDLKRPVRVESFLLGPTGSEGHRLVVDLHDIALAPQRIAEPQPANTAGQRDVIVVIDAGHGGKDPGALGGNGEQEKVVALAIARLLAQKLNRQRGFKAQLVRNQDVFVPLRKRVEVARRHNADLFISVHADAAPRRSASGASVFALSENGATSTTARWMAERENSADLLGARELLSLKNKDPVLAGVLLDMSLNSTISTSLGLGKTVLDNVGKVAGVHQKRVEQAGFAVLKSPDIPSILVETGFISNPADCRKLCDPLHQKRVAQAIFDGLQKHFVASPPTGTFLASQKNGSLT
ncbi:MULTISPECIES: N-acetylmuramoyl-L-alanine amidase [unclassified Pseudomonas]|uniref:N-acetylmuramoyl-L-alanine amidase n=1 Tax=unclassified Pseudomonas TaxID=196821 RepID=UPI00095CEF8A|nr:MULTISPECIES: N-acetylmuramoyl-L-alanine amidase [unclassified Pseudomonas]OLU16940.1 N-acetylmuramoyl-L-alanine amidase [Pseudomonas sp. PA1(2017)]OLU33849.1 N-acetylmuramoyl-L-alanine amidase [Pseudomonas sp. PA27(2017)]